MFNYYAPFLENGETIIEMLSDDLDYNNAKSIAKGDYIRCKKIDKVDESHVGKVLVINLGLNAFFISEIYAVDGGDIFFIDSKGKGMTMSVDEDVDAFYIVTSVIKNRNVA